jgi:predicted MFS family arabinose efflux permease
VPRSLEFGNSLGTSFGNLKVTLGASFTVWIIITKGVSYNPWVGIVFGVLTFVMIGRQYDAKKTLSSGTRDRSAEAKNAMIIGKLG